MKVRKGHIWRSESSVHLQNNVERDVILLQVKDDLLLDDLTIYYVIKLGKT